MTHCNRVTDGGLTRKYISCINHHSRLGVFCTIPNSDIDNNIKSILNKNNFVKQSEVHLRIKPFRSKAIALLKTSQYQPYKHHRANPPGLSKDATSSDTQYRFLICRNHNLGDFRSAISSKSIGHNINHQSSSSCRSARLQKRAPGRVFTTSKRAVSNSNT